MSSLLPVVSERDVRDKLSVSYGEAVRAEVDPSEERKSLRFPS